jgi:predicted MFS family arabinose efflux permease
MRIAKPLLLTTTPIGLAFGVYEGWRLAGGLVFLMIALVSFIGVAMATVVLTVRREKREEEEAARQRAQGAEVANVEESK